MKKVFLIVGGECIFFVGEIEVLFMKVGGEILLVNCMIVFKVCFVLLVGLDVFKFYGVVIDLKRNLFIFDI